MNKKLLATSITALLLVVMLSPMALAQTCLPGQVPGVDCELGGPGKDIGNIGGLLGLVMVVLKWMYTILFVVATLFILVAAFKYVTSKGDPEKVKEANHMIIYAIVGMVIALISFGVVRLIQSSVSTL